jgi:uncharacterized membrane protein
MPRNEQAALLAVARLSIRESIWHGPLPPPKVLKAYNDAIPHGAERIMVMAEDQLAHQHGVEKKELFQSARGQLFAFIIAIVFLIASAFLIFTGHEMAGSVLGTVDLVALATTFIAGKSTR